MPCAYGDPKIMRQQAIECVLAANRWTLNRSIREDPAIGAVRACHSGVRAVTKMVSTRLGEFLVRLRVRRRYWPLGCGPAPFAPRGKTAEGFDLTSDVDVGLRFERRRQGSHQGLVPSLLVSLSRALKGFSTRASTVRTFTCQWLGPRTSSGTPRFSIKRVVSRCTSDTLLSRTVGKAARALRVLA